MIEDVERLENDLKVIKKKVDLLKSSMEDLEMYFDRVSGFADRNRIKIDNLVEYFMQQVDENSSKEIDKITSKDRLKERSTEPRPPVEEKVKTITPERITRKNLDLKENSIPKKSRSDMGVMIFLSPDVKRSKKLDDSSTCIPRRQLVPSSSEEKMIIDYLIKSNIRPTKGEYKQIYKEICRMLLNSPTNAIAIQLKTVRKDKNKTFAELLYHVKIKDKVEYAALKYIELKGVEYYRRLRTS